MENTKYFIVDDADAGQRLDKFLSEKLPEFSRSEITKFNIFKIKSDEKLPVKFSEKTRTGDEYSVVITHKDYHAMASSNDFDLDILFEDDDIIVINKPRGIVMYPSAGNNTGTLVQNILSHTTLSILGGDTRPGVVHRLDKDTSGVVVLAKSDAAFRELTQMFALHNLTRRYIAFVWGVPGWETATITGNIARSTKNRQKMTMVKVGGRPAQTEITVKNIWSRDKVSEFECTLLTGRTHQIRVHLSTHGFPVICDPTYGRGNSRLGGVKNHELLEFVQSHDGQMLHAAILEFDHPITGEKLKFKSKIPFDMKQLKDILDAGMTIKI